MPVHDVQVAVIYYSSTGTVAELARRIADAAEHAGAEVRLRRTAELAPQDRRSTPTRRGRRTPRPPPRSLEATPRGRALGGRGDLRDPPTRFGNVSSQLKQFLDTLGGAVGAGQAGGQGLQRLHRERHHARRPGVHAARALPRPPPLRRHRRGAGLHRPGEVRRRQPLRHLPRRRPRVNPVDETARTGARVQAERVVKFAGAVKDGLAQAS